MEKTRISGKRTRLGLLLAALALSWLYGGAARATTVATYSFQATGLAGSVISYFPYPQTFLEAFVDLNSLGVVDATVSGTGVVMDLSWDDYSSAAAVIATTLGGGSLYSQTLFGGGGITIEDTSYDLLGSGSLSGGVIYAAPGASTATIVLSVSNYAGIGAESGPSSGNLVLTGATASPVSLVTTEPCMGCFVPLPYLDGFSLDWTATYQTAPYVLAGLSAVPELPTWAMLALGFAGLSVAGWTRRATGFS
jgi:hypothetical protein